MRMSHLIAKIVKKTLIQKTNETLINLFKCGVIMEGQITYGTTIHHDGTIAKYECWTFETETEFWNHYEQHANGDTKADIPALTVTKRIYISVAEYRHEQTVLEGEE